MPRKVPGSSAAPEVARRRPQGHQGADPAHHAEEDLAAGERGRAHPPEDDRDEQGDGREREPLEPRPRRGRALRPRRLVGHPPAQLRQARSRSPAMGEALTSPPPECSTSTAIATCGLSYGAKPMNHECGACPGPSSAVPDLPATTMFRRAAPAVKIRPMSPLTARRIAAAISWAMPGATT